MCKRRSWTRKAQAAGRKLLLTRKKGANTRDSTAMSLIRISAKQVTHESRWQASRYCNTNNQSSGLLESPVSPVIGNTTVQMHKHMLLL